MISLIRALTCCGVVCSAPLGCSPSETRPRSGLAPAAPSSEGQPPVKLAGASGSSAPAGRQPEVSFYAQAPIPFRMELAPAGEPEACIELTSTSLAGAAQDRVRNVVESELARYPEGVLDPILDLVLIGGDLSVLGLRANGAYVFGSVFLAIGDIDRGEATDARVIATLHHEISSLVLRAHRDRFDEARFREALPTAFRYEAERIENGDLQSPRTWEFEVSLGYLEAGFLWPWAMRSLEQDFNSYAQELFVRPPRLLRMFATESPVARKARVVRDLYLSVDPRFAEVFDSEGSPILFPQAPALENQSRPSTAKGGQRQCDGSRLGDAD